MTQVGSVRDARQPAARPSLDATLSSTTPDVPREPARLTAISTIGWSTAIGAGIGALLLRSSGAGSLLGSLAGGIARGALVGGGIGGALLGLDHLTDGQVKRQLDYVSLDRRAQLWFVLSNPTKPWIAGTGIGVATDARAAQERLYGPREPLDGPQDAFRHAYASGLFALRAMRDHGADVDSAHQLAIDAGEAHEVDGQDNNDAFSRSMDTANNLAGTVVLGDGRARAGEAATADGWLTEAGLRDRILAAMVAGRLTLVDRSGGDPTPRPSSAGDLPPAT